MFEQLGEKLQKVFKNLRGYGKLSEKNITEALREIRMAMLEADVHYSVVKGFLDRVKEKALGQEVLKSISPGQQMIKVVHDELVELLGHETASVFSEEKVLKILLVGLQGSGKTTTAGKLASLLKKKGKKPLLVSCDTQRPAAQDQLNILADQLHIPFFTIKGEKKPEKIVIQSLDKIKELGADTLIIDTAGRLHVDKELMQEVAQIKRISNPQEILFVADAMTGQDAVQSAKAFNESVEATGVVLTKLDGDSRGGAALSIHWVTGKPIKFCGVGEKLDQLEPFHPQRMASRILGMGDVVSLVEKAQENVTQEEALELQQKLQKGAFTFEDFLVQMRQLKKMGGLGEMLKMIPGMGSLNEVNLDDGEMKRTEAIILSMTPLERREPTLLDLSRRQRLASGSGTSLNDVNGLIKRFQRTQKMMKKMKGMGKKFPKSMQLPTGQIPF